MIGQSLFQRFFWRYLMTLILAIGLLIFMTHLYQAKYNQRQMEHLDRQALAFSETWQLVRAKEHGAEWREAQELTRLVVFDRQWRVVVDSHPERGADTLELFRVHKRLNHAMTSMVPLQDGLQAVLIKPHVLRFPHTFQPTIPWLFNGPQWRLVGILLAIAVLISLILYPLVRGMSHTFQELGILATQVADGHFGKELKVKRRDELGGLVDAFNHMSRKLAQAEQLNQRLIHDVSHELRSPLGRIRVLADTLRFKPETAQVCVEEIHREVALLDRMVEDMIQAAKMEAAAGAALAQSFGLFDWAKTLCNRLAKQIKAKSKLCEYHLPKTNLRVTGDPQRLTQAVSNLVDNALVAIDPKPNGKIEIEFEVIKDVWEIRVRDNGVGIPAADQPFVLRRFYRVDEHRNRDSGGVGLGLSIVKAIVTQHHGDLDLQSEEGEGTVVTLRFPVNSSEKA